MALRYRKIKAGTLIVFLNDEDRIGILAKRCYKHGSHHWEVIMQDTGKIQRVLELNLANCYNRYKFV